jgi:hypothetical protein
MIVYTLQRLHNFIHSLGHAGQVATRPKGFFGLKMRGKGKWAEELFFQFFKQRFDFKSHVFKYF